MPIPQQFQQAIQKVADQRSFINVLLRQALEWEIPEGVGDVEEIAYEWSTEDLRAEGLDEKIVDGQVWQIQPLNAEAGQQWGIFVLEFKNDRAFVTGRGLTGPLRKVLRGLVQTRRRRSNLPAWDRENLLFICTYEYKHFRFAYFKPTKQKGQAQPLAMFGWDSGDAALRTLCEYNLPFLLWSDNPQQPQWRDAFNVEKVTKGFYGQVAKIFTDLVGGIRKQGRQTYEGKNLLILPGSQSDTVRKEFAVRLIGRLVFCWFLKKKKSEVGLALVPEELLSTRCINNKGIGGYYHSILEPLFFEVLNTPHDKRNKQFTKAPWSIIPFLNGGLFTPHEDDFYKLTFNGISKHLNDLIIPDDLIREFFEVFETYNFTIEESTPLDIEVAVDPEILGRIFENLLAEINPETGETARKSTGSYYTPRPIVEYMVDESLKLYLLTKTELSEERISALLSYAQEAPVLTDAQKNEVLDSLETVKVIDPACGSGAFPMGILQKILLILQKLDPDSKIWTQKMIDGMPGSSLRQHWKGKLKVPNYLHKLGIIRECIFGVDIQPIAVEISKLRCFLSLIVDENVNDDESNRGIEHLPNLEFKFVCANSLIALPEKHDKGQRTMFEAVEKIDELKELRDLYLTSYGNEKKDIEKQFRNVQSEMFQHSLDWGGKESQTLKLSQWNPFSDKASSWFDPDWMFGVKRGFDIVIGNPPWGQKSVKFSPQEKQYFKEQYPAAVHGILDIFRLFIERSISITSERGTFTNVLPDIVLLKNYDSTRKYVLDHLSLKNIDHWGMAFENVNMDSCTIIGQKEAFLNDNVVLARIHTKNNVIVNEIMQSQFLKTDGYKFNLYLNEKTLRLMDKLHKEERFEDYFNPHEGIHSGNIRNKLFIDKKENRFSKKLIFGRKEVQKYYLCWNGKWVNYNPKTIIKEKGEYAGLGKADYFEQEKIVVRRTGDYILAALDQEGFYFSNNVFVCIPKPDNQINLKYVLGILNSKISTWYYRNIQPRRGKLFAELKINVLKKLPLKRSSNKEEKEIVKLVECIILCKKQNKNTDKLESELNSKVYELYKLSQNEIDYIEYGEKLV